MGSLRLHLLYPAVAAAIVAIAVPASAGQAAAAGARFTCSDQLARADASMTARFERQGGRQKFTVEAEAAPKGPFDAGDVLRVEVDNIRVGRIVLRRGVKDLVGDLNFDTRPDAGEKPFPPQFPKDVGAGTVVEAGPFRCALQRR